MRLCHVGAGESKVSLSSSLVGTPLDLSADDRRALEGLAHRDDRQGERARVLLEADGLSARDAAAACGVAATTVARWRNRYRELGPGGLVDRERSGRPAPATDRELLRALLIPRDEPWTTRRVAERFGVSQSVVARAWSASFAPSAEARAVVGHGGRVLLGLRVDARGSVIALGTLYESQARRPAEHRNQGSLRTLLALDQVRPRRGGEGAARFVRSLAAEPSDIVVLSSSGTARSQPDWRVVRQWGSLLAPLASAIVEPEPDQLRHVAHAAALWAASESDDAFVWSLDQGSPSPNPGRGPSMSPVDPLGPAVTAVCSALREGGGVADGAISTSALALLMGCSRDAARRCLVRLESEGLLLAGRNGASRLIVPTPDEVLEVYAARRSLGSLLVRRAASERPGLALTRRALEQFVRVGKTDQPWVVGEADLAFQDALAHDAGAPRIARMFCRLTQQLRLFIATLGLRYSYPGDASVQDDHDLLVALEAGDEMLALELWRSKMSRAVGYMVQQLPRESRSRSTGMVRYLDADL
jgi:DNA-binding GntR family transcriptional regulator/transposase